MVKTFKEIEGDTKTKWKDISRFELEESIVKMSTLPKIIFTFNTIPIKILTIN
jgi:hypothetical protein